MASHAAGAATAAGSLRLEAVASSSSHNQPDSEFIAFKASMRLPIAPVFASKGDNLFPGHDGGMDGVREVLAGWVMRYLPPLRAVLLSFSPTPRFLHPAQRFRSSRVPFDSMYESGDESEEDQEEEGGAADAAKRTVWLKSLPMVDGSGFTLANVEWEGVGWRPRVGMKVVGTLTLASASHVSLLLHNLFNASIPVSHIPTETWEWDPDYPVPPVVLERRNAALPLKQVVSDVVEKANEAAKVDQEDGGGDAATEDLEKVADEQEEAEKEEEEAEFAERGWWVHRKSREPLGGQDGRLEFTLVGLTTSNSLLSCTGSLLAEPFSASAIASLQSSLLTPLSASSTLLQSKLSTKGKKRARDDDEVEEVIGGGGGDGESDSDDSDDDDDEEEEGLDADDDDRVGTGIPRGHGAQAIPRFNEDDDGSAASESSRSPSPEPVPPPVKKSKKAKAAATDKVEAGEAAAPQKKSKSKKAKA